MSTSTDASRHAERTNERTNEWTSQMLDFRCKRESAPDGGKLSNKTYLGTRSRDHQQSPIDLHELHPSNVTSKSVPALIFRIFVFY